jgi:hypothetical protein
MNNASFNRINLNIKAQFVFKYGEYISSIEYYGRNVDLYIVGAFYVEAFYNRERQELEEIEILDPEERRLQLYSIGVDIKNLFE